MRRIAAVLFAFSLVCCFTCHTFAQQGSATLTGFIQDSSKAVIPGVKVTAINTNTNQRYGVTTAKDGSYTIAALPVGPYQMQIEKPGFKTILKDDLFLHTQDALEINFQMAVGSTSETITVNGSSVNMNTTDGSVSTVVDRQFVENMPLNGRSFQDLLTLAPGVAEVGNAGNGGNSKPGQGGEISVNGQRTEANYFTVDGVSANVGTAPGNFGLGAGFQGATPGGTALGTTQSIISVDALQEFRATTSTYSAEYGRTPGGQFSITTRSGANDWHGSTYDYFRNEALDSNNWFLDQLGQPKEKERQNDFGGTLGGPVIVPGLYNGKDKTFFFFSYEGLRLWTPQGLQTNSVPDSTLRQSAPSPLQPLLNSLPLPNAGEDGLNDGFGLYTVGASNPSSIDGISVRVDHIFSDKFRVFGRYADTPTVTSSFNSSFETSSNVNNRLVTLGATTTIAARQTNELRFNITDSSAVSRLVSTSLGGALPLDLSTIPGPNGTGISALGGTLNFCFCFGNQSSGSVGQFANTQRQYNVTDTHIWNVRNHNLRFGVDWRRLSTYSVPVLIGEYAYFYSEDSILANSMDFALASSASPTPVEPVYKNFSVFAQDEWRVSPRFSLSLGLRWDVNPAPGNLTGPSPYTLNQITDLATAQLAPAGTPLWETDWHAFAPRIGVAYQVSQTAGHETVVRGGFGTFYDMGSGEGSFGFNGIGFGGNAQYTGVNFPLTSTELTLPPASIAAPYDNFVIAFDPHVKLPYTLQWNASLQQALGTSNALTVSYVGAGGRELLTTFGYSPENLGNPNFSGAVCGGCLQITKNGATSNYDALQIQFQRRLSHGLQALVAYTWSHSIDDASSNFLLRELLRGSSDFDIRHNFQAAATYDVPGRYSNSILSAVLEHWGLDARISARSSLPVNIIGRTSVDPITQTRVSYNPDIVSGQPLYLYGSQYPGGRVLNFDAYQRLPVGVEGDAGRNSARGFGAAQANLALRRDFPLGERLRMQFRAEAFNFLNHPNFASVNNNLSSGRCGPPQPGQTLFCFGAAGSTLNSSLGGLNALYQIGGPRSMQIALKIIF